MSLSRSSSLFEGTEGHFFIYLTPSCSSFHVRRESLFAWCTHTARHDAVYLFQVAPHLNGTFKLAVKNNLKGKDFFFWLHISPRLCRVALWQRRTKKDTPIALETVISVSHFCGRSEQVTDQWLKLWKNGWQRNRRPAGSHLFLHTFDSQIFTVLSLETKRQRGGMISSRKSRRTQQRGENNRTSIRHSCFQNKSLYIRHNTKTQTSKSTSNTHTQTSLKTLPHGVIVKTPLQPKV